MKIEGIKALIFDLGGTLYRPVTDMCNLTREFFIDLKIEGFRQISDSEIVEATKGPDEWLNNYMIENEVDMHWVPDTDVWIEYDRLLLDSFGINDAKIVKRYQEKWEDFLESAHTELIEGCKQGLEKLHERGFKLGVASNRFGDPSEILKEDSILDLFDAVEYTNVPGYRKPSPYMLIRVAQMLRMNPSRCAYIGNVVKFDVEAASRAGMIPVLITWIDPQEADLVTSDTVIIEHIDDLMEIL
ncbi:MAG: HAD family hydrolase [Candidatus Thorarchaeota archaeon]|jgi:HAD superfamily hydrolase (TIGR01549 family)